MTIFTGEMKRRVSRVILSINRHFVHNQIFGQLEVSLLTGDVEAVAAAHVGGLQDKLQGKARQGKARQDKTRTRQWYHTGHDMI